MFFVPFHCVHQDIIELSLGQRDRSLFAFSIITFIKRMQYLACGIDPTLINFSLLVLVGSPSHTIRIIVLVVALCVTSKEIFLYLYFFAIVFHPPIPDFVR